MNNFYGWVMYQKGPINRFKWVEETPQFNEDFIKGYIKESNKWYFFIVDAQYPQNLHDLHQKACC